mmetsp:Transcript_85707/g.135338  ORF Transcript_85707/g.135338 Transcript_85707/m.135338 type:complete len:240 (+) Transcript_85707:88-807(+)
MGAQVVRLPIWEDQKSPNSDLAVFNVLCCQSDNIACLACDVDALGREDNLAELFGVKYHREPSEPNVPRVVEVIGKSPAHDPFMWPHFPTQSVDQHVTSADLRDRHHFAERQLNSLPTPQRVSPAAPRHFNHAEVDSCVGNAAKLAALPPPPRTAPGAKGSSSSVAPIRRVLHVKVGGRWMHLSFLDCDDLDQASADFISFIRRDGIEIGQVRIGMVNRMKSMNLLGLQEDFVDAEELR